MAKTAAFGADNSLINIFDSLKAAKAELKDEKDVVFVTEKNFDELNAAHSFVDADGVILTKETLFPAPEKKEKEKVEKADGEKRTRTTIAYEGEYHVVKNNGARFAIEDERGALHDALVSNTTVETYLEAAPKEANYVSTKGKPSTCSAKAWYGYAIKRGWVKPGPAPEPEAQEAA